MRSTRLGLYTTWVLVGTPWLGLMAQLSDTVRVPEVTVFETRDLPFQTRPVGTLSTELDITTLVTTQGSITDALMRHTALNVREYGPGGIATMSLRGGLGQHVQVYWQGIPLTDPMLGLTDLSVLMMLGANSVRILHGPASRVLGTGSLSGAIDLRMLPADSGNVRAWAEVGHGSFNTWRSGAGAAFSKGRWSSSTSAALTYADNNFTYQDLARFGQPLDTMRNAMVRQQGVSHGTSFKINQRNSIRFDGLWLRTDRQLPPTMVAPQTRDALLDDKLTAALTWDRKGKRSNLQVMGAYQTSDQWYFDQKADSTYYNTSTSFIGRIGYAIRPLPKLEIQARQFTDVVWAISNGGYSNGVMQQTYGGMVVVEWRPMSLLAAEIIWRANAIDGKFSPGQALAGLELVPIKLLKLRLSGGMNTRFPTLNDRFWQPGGNPTLQPERSYSVEFGADVDKRWNELHIKLSGTFYYMVYDGLIQWRPTGSYWSPENVRGAQMLGTTTDLSAEKRWGRFTLTGTVAHQYTNSTVIRSTIANDASIGHQLMYIPQQQLKASLAVSAYHARIALNFIYVGSRKVTSDGSQTMPAYALINLQLGYDLPAGKHHLVTALFAINNLSSTDYQTLQWRAMPGRNYLLTIKYQFNSKP